MTEQFRDDVYSLLAYTLSSAVGCVTEPKIYGPMRLADVAARLVRLLDEQGLLADEKLDAIAGRIEEDKFLCMDDQEGFVKMLGDTSGMMAELINSES